MQQQTQCVIYVTTEMRLPDTDKLQDLPCRMAPSTLQTAIKDGLTGNAAATDGDQRTVDDG